eukprot:gene7063-5003_t
MNEKRWRLHYCLSLTETPKRQYTNMYGNGAERSLSGSEFVYKKCCGILAPSAVRETNKNKIGCGEVRLGYHLSHRFFCVPLSATPHSLYPYVASVGMRVDSRRVATGSNRQTQGWQRPRNENA